MSGQWGPVECDSEVKDENSFICAFKNPRGREKEFVALATHGYVVIDVVRGNIRDISEFSVGIEST